MSDIDVFGCEVDLIDFTNYPCQQPSTQHSRKEESCKLWSGHVWLKATPCGNSKKVIARTTPKQFESPSIRVENSRTGLSVQHLCSRILSSNGIQHVGFAAWQGCQQLQIVKLPPLVLSLEDGAFQGCCALREVVAPGCVQFSRRAFAECCSLSSIGVSQTTDGDNVLAPGAQLGRYAFESCLTLSSITFVMDQTNKARALPEGAFCGSGLEALCLPNDFHNIGPRACENCKRLVEVNLMCTEITECTPKTLLMIDTPACRPLPGPKELTLVEPLTRPWDKPSRSPPCCNCGCALKSPYGETWQQPEIPQPICQQKKTLSEDTGSAERSPRLALPVPVGMVETQADEADEATEDEAMNAEPSYAFAKGYGRFGIGYRLATALGNFEQGDIGAESAVVAQWLTSGLRIAMSRTGWNLISTRFSLTTGEALCGETGFCCGFWTPNWCPEKSLFSIPGRSKKLGKLVRFENCWGESVWRV